MRKNHRLFCVLGGGLVWVGSRSGHDAESAMICGSKASLLNPLLTLRGTGIPGFRNQPLALDDAAQSIGVDDSNSHQCV